MWWEVKSTNPRPWEGGVSVGRSVLSTLESLHHTTSFDPAIHPISDLPTHFVLKLNSGWLLDWWMLKSLKIMYTGWQRILKDERKSSILFRFWHHSYIRYRIRSSVCALLVDMNRSTDALLCSIRAVLEEAAGAGGKLGADQAPYRGDRGNLT